MNRQENLREEELVEFMAVNPIGRVVDYKRKSNLSS